MDNVLPNMKEECKDDVLPYATPPRILKVSYVAVASVILPMFYRIFTEMMQIGPENKVFAPSLGLRARLLTNLCIHCGPYAVFGALGVWSWWRGRGPDGRANELASIAGVLLNLGLMANYGVHIYHEYNGYL